MTRRRDRINGEWNTPDKPFTWEHATIEVLMDIRRHQPDRQAAAQRGDARDQEEGEMTHEEAAEIEKLRDELATFRLGLHHQENEKLRAERDALKVLLKEARPVVDSEAALFDSMTRHMEGGFPVDDVAAADKTANYYADLLVRIDAALASGEKDEAALL